MNKYINKIREIIIEKTGLDAEEVREESYFEDDLNIGEMELLEIIASLEEEYEIEFTEDEKEKIAAVIDLVEIVVEKAE